MKLTLALLLTLFHRVATTSEADEAAIFDILNSPEYNKESRPNTTGGNATLIRVNLKIRKINNIDDIQMSFTTQLTFRQKWTDERLKFGGENTSSDMKYITLNDVVAEKLWTPDLFFSNEAESFVHKVMKPNSYKRVYPSGMVMWSTRITITFSCPMDLQSFPFDKQICPMFISSYSGTNQAVKILWDEETPVILREDGRYSRFSLIKHETGYCYSESYQSSRIFSNASKDEFSCIVVNLYLQRQKGFYITQIYAPIFMYVLMSWVSFYLGHLISARLTLTVTLLLTCATQIQGVNANLPQVSYVRALDIWTGVCLTFCSLAIFETATVAFLMQRENNSGNLIGSFDMKSKKKATSPLGAKLDRASCIVFPVCFFFFVLVYVLIYVIPDNPVDRSNFINKSID